MEKAEPDNGAPAPVQDAVSDAVLRDIARCFDSPLSRPAPEAVRAALHPQDVPPVLDDLVQNAGLYALQEVLALT